MNSYYLRYLEDEDEMSFEEEWDDGELDNLEDELDQSIYS